MEWSQKKKRKNTRIKIMSEEIKKEAVKKEDKIVVAPDKDTTKKKSICWIRSWYFCKRFRTKSLCQIDSFSKSSRQLENFSKSVYHNIHYTLVQVCNLVHGITKSYNGTIRIDINCGWCWCGLVWFVHRI